MSTIKVPLYGKSKWLNSCNSNVNNTNNENETINFCVNPGDNTGFNSDEYLKGHGVYSSSDNDNLVACVRGECIQTDQVISVIPLSNRYAGNVGDVVVGRIVLVGPNRWFVDLNGTQDAFLPLTSVHLPDGEQRRRTAKDEMQMRDIFTEGDIVAAEVQNIYRDGAIVLQTRSKKFGALSNGVLVKSTPSLIKHLEQHIVTMESIGVQIIFGLNGYLWVSADSSKKMHHEIANVANAIKLLTFNSSIICPESILKLLKGNHHEKKISSAPLFTSSV
jgi:exosome complex RNA-binding protein Rrp4